MKYDAVIEDFLKEFPEFCEEASERQRYWGSDSGEEPSPYIFFGSVVNPHLSEELEKSKGDENLLKRIFAFLERMALSQDSMTYELLGTGITEVFGDNSLRLKNARKYMGPATGKTAMIWKGLGAGYTIWNLYS